MLGLLLVVVWATSATCLPRHDTHLLPKQFNNGTGTPCAAVSASAASFRSVSPSAIPTVAADLAYDCITSVPFNLTAAYMLVMSLYPYANWQSTLAYLKNPPATYAELVQPPTDLLGKLDNLTFDIYDRKFENEYDFGWALYSIFHSAHDGHLAFVPDVVGDIFSFSRPISLVSVSIDGKDIPKIYTYPDILASTGNVTFTPSVVAKIDDKDAVDFLLELSQTGTLQDRDALWNNLFFSVAATSLGPGGSGPGMFAGNGRGRLLYPGAMTNLTFENGSTLNLNNYAYVLANFTGVTSGEDLYRKFFTTSLDAQEIPPPPSQTSIYSLPTQTPTPTSIPAPGYPPPIFRNKANVNSGYFLEGKGFEDIAVLSVQSFEVAGAGAGANFQSLNQQFLAKAKAAGKTKLIVDVSANGGGTISQGYDLFRQLFPAIQEVGLQRFRAFEATNLIGQKISEVTENYGNSSIQDYIASPFNYRFDMTEDAKPFLSWPAKFGPHELYGDNFTSLFRWDWSDPWSWTAAGDIMVTGYRNRTNLTQPFAREEIVVLTDGYCASTCALFSQFMRDRGGVKHFAIGGRPNSDPMQAVGGVKGANNLAFQQINDVVISALELGVHHNTTLDWYEALPIIRSSSAGVNFRDELNPGDATQTPRQFIYEPSDCRLFYTPQMTVDIAESWRAVASIAWGNGTCISGDEVAYRMTKRRPTNKFSGAKRDLPKLPKMAAEDIQALMDSMNIITDVRGMQGDGLMIP